ncbi:MAG: Nif3-like dinuclear metal center hexameric protein, partial [Planctomycetaceae bacterium]
MATVGEICGVLREIAPLELAESWDNVGLLLGDERAEVRRLMTCLTLTEDVAAEAAEG